ncbi:HD-GYP domain-containing protein [Paenibacillus sp. D2_2]|uniref:HD-GYP domain-containing protein n=1 Tax=Paenibacillus sp. D2_2 TaxID=3073092 RepID=UPI0028167F9E|nr:HD-GYP domain-containing protein [Paenibacillus sp. D2_2]WMT41545.1 HD-GYP domain-containing protein [Paenibacillus sp. D2_2]
MLYSLSLQFGTEGWELGRVTSWYWAIGVLSVGLGYSFIGSRLLAREIVMPIQHLYERMSDVQIGYMQTSASDLFSDEFSRLIWGFNHMLRGINVQHARNNQLVESYFATLAAALDARDPYTAGHSLRVADYAVLIGKLAKLREEELNELRKSALLHDIGKIGIRDSVLLKEGKLTDEEWVQVKDHPVLGETILRQIEPASFMASILPGVRSHHERYDGRGYPDGLQGEDIPLFGRIIAVADAFDAMTSDRPYRAGLDRQKALVILDEGRGTQWDPYFVALFVEHMQKDGFDEQNLDIRRTSP